MLICGRPAMFGDKEQIEAIHQERMRLQRLKDCEKDGIDVPKDAYTNIDAYKRFIDEEFGHDYLVVVKYTACGERAFNVRAEDKDSAEEIASDMFEQWAENDMEIDYFRTTLCE